MAQQVFKSPTELSNDLRDKDNVLTPLSDDDYKYYTDALVKVSKDVLGGSDYLDKNGYFIHNDRSHGTAEDRINAKYKDNPEITRKLNKWITYNSIPINSKFDESYIELYEDLNDIQYDQLTKWLDKYFNRNQSVEVNYQDGVFGKYLGNKRYSSHQDTVDDIIKDIKRFYASRKRL